MRVIEPPILFQDISLFFSDICHRNIESECSIEINLIKISKFVKCLNKKTNMMFVFYTINCITKSKV